MSIHDIRHTHNEYIRRLDRRDDAQTLDHLITLFLGLGAVAFVLACVAVGLG